MANRVLTLVLKRVTILVVIARRRRKERHSKATLELAAVIITAHAEGPVNRQSLNKVTGDGLTLGKEFGSREDARHRGVGSLGIIQAKPCIMVADRGEGVRGTRDLRIRVDKVTSSGEALG
jgi:hypothetical protein